MRLMIPNCLVVPYLFQGVSLVTGTEVQRPLLEPLANQCGARFVATPEAHTFADLEPSPVSEAANLRAYGPDRGSSESEAATC